MSKLTMRQQGIADFQALLRRHNAILVGDRGVNRAYSDFVTENGLSLAVPTKQQQDYEKLLNTAAPLMESKKV